MAGIFTRSELNKIMNNADLTADQRTEQVYSLYGRALDDGYISKTAATQAQETALAAAKTEWEKAQTIPDPTESDAYKKLRGEFDDYKAMQGARGSKDYEGVKPKFFETVYGMIDRKEGAKPIADQMTAIRSEFEEYFMPQQGGQDGQGGAPKPNFGAPVEGGMPKGETGAVKTFSDAWGFGPRKA